MSDTKFGIFGGQYIPETLMNAVLEVQNAYEKYKNDKDFISDFNKLLVEYANRPSKLYYAKKLTEEGKSTSSAAKEAAEISGIKKGDIYKALIG